MSNDLGNILGTSAAQNTDANWGRSQKLAYRYVDGYKSSSTLIKLGNIIKIIGYIIAALIVLGGFIAFIVAASNSSPGSGMGVFLLCLLYAGLVILGAFVYGSVIAALGHILRASQDGAVNNSPLITDNERASILSLD
jgi:uncharacterized integral membrane protein